MSVKRLSSNLITNTKVNPGLPTVTGGTLYSDTNYYYRAFTATGNLVVTGGSLMVDALVVAGGGGCATSPYTGGAGAGGLVQITGQVLSPRTYFISIGAGGAQGNVNVGNQGSDSGFIVTAFGGAKGDEYYSINGGSGSGGYTNVAGGLGVVGQGNNGGTGGSAAFCMGGGGGAGGVGGNGSNTTTYTGGAGGIGATSALINAMGSATGLGQLSGGNYYFAGGGGGYNGGAGGLGGGGTAGTAGTVNTGGGGGQARAGGSGVVIVRYLKSAVA